MSRANWLLFSGVAAFTTSVFLACGPQTPPEEPTITLRITPRQLPADGTEARITIEATAADGSPGTGPIELSALAGSFDGAGPTGYLILANGTASAVYGCNAEVDIGCTGTIRITAAWNDVTAVSTVVLSGADAGTDGGLPGDGLGPASNTSKEFRMSRLARLSVAISLAFALSRCTQEPPPPEPDPLIVTSNVEEVDADGTTTVLISVTGAKTPVRLTVTQGTWRDSDKAISNLDGDGSRTLVTCDSRLSPTCAVRVKVNAVAEDGAIGSVFVTFNQLEVCTVPGDEDENGKADCADAVCADQSCELPGGAGTGTCTAGGTCECSAGNAEICDDGMDNNCDGLVDCADSKCANLRCELPSGLGGFCTSAKTCACPTKAEVCNDNVDNDCDGLVDAATLIANRTGTRRAEPVTTRATPALP